MNTKTKEFVQFGVCVVNIFAFASGTDWRLPCRKCLPWAKTVVGLKNISIVFEN